MTNEQAGLPRSQALSPTPQPGGEVTETRLPQINSTPPQKKRK